MKKLMILLVGFFWNTTAWNQVSPQSGSATFNLPLFEWKDDKSKLASAISLNYSSGSGLKVNEMASNIGQGWRMTGAGAITRIQVGQPDDQRAYDPGNPANPYDRRNLDRYPAGLHYHSQDVSKGCPGTLAKYPIYGHRNQLYAPQNDVTADRELDYFTYEFNGNSGMFVIPKDNGGQGVFLNDSKMKVWYDKNENNAALNNIRTTIIAFYIQDQMGVIYKYARYETTQILKYTYFDPKTQRQLTQPDFQAGQVYHEGAFPDNNISHPNVINSWYLTEISDPLTNRRIVFNYGTVSINSNAGISLSYYDTKDYSIVSHSFSKTETPELASIVYPDGHEVLMGYGSSRIDMPGSRAMRYIDIRYNSRYISKYDLKTSYFIRNRYGIPSNDYQAKSARLCLLSIQRTGVDLRDMENPYTFQYYAGSTGDDMVPPPFFYARDIWGYYNGFESRQYSSNLPIDITKDVNELTNDQIRGLCFLRFASGPDLLNSKPGYAKIGLLRQIVYPAGGVLRYEYERNQFNFGTGLENVGGVHVSRTILSDAGYSNSCDSAIITNYYYVESNGASSLWGLETPQNLTEAKQFYRPERRYAKWKPIANVSCDYRFRYPGILSREQATSLSAAERLAAALAAFSDVYSAVTTSIDIIKYASGGSIGNIIVDLVASIIGAFLSCTGPYRTIDETINVYGNSEINAFNPLPAQFRRVEIAEGGGSSGKTVMEFTSPSDADGAAIWVQNNDIRSMRQRFPFWAYGLPKKTTVYNADGTKVKETENLYLYRPILYGDPKLDRHTEFLSCKCLVKRSSSQRNTDWNNPVHYNDPASYVRNKTGTELWAELYNINAGRAELTDTYERTYKIGNSTVFQQNHTSYSYNSGNYQVSEMISDLTNGDRQVKTIRYSSDFSTGILQTLKNNNILNAPVASATYLIKSAETERKLMNESVTEFTTLPNNDIRPFRVLEQRFNAPVRPPYSIYQGPAHASNPSYKVLQTIMYNVRSELASVKDEGNRSAINIYDYDSKQIVASVINADGLVDKSAYTSFETGSFGGWLPGGTATYDIGLGVTGSRAFRLTSSNSLTSTITPNRPHIISFWSNGTVNLSIGTLVRSGPVVNGFTYFEYRVPQTDGTVVVRGNCNIDELRSYPTTARMQTATYDPLIGKTSECDENNRITYYEYEELGRLKFIKDDQGNILKMYEYNTIAYKANGCDALFTSKAITEVFTRSNCGIGYEGTNVPITIPAGAYSSTISQAMADAQAEIELEEQGQNRANTQGQCTRIYGNQLQSRQFTRDNCGPGLVGSTVTYTVAADTYFSKIDVADANRMALEEIESNGYSYAIEHGTCTTSTTPVWEYDGVTAVYTCEKDASNNNTGRQLVQMRDMNPNSVTYNQLQWKDAGESSSCPRPSYTLTRTNSCGGVNSTYTLNGYAGDVVVLRITFSGTVSWNGSANGAGGSASLTGGGQSCSAYSPRITTVGTTGFTTECNITFTMPAASVNLNSTAAVHNTTTTTSAGLTLRVVSINGVSQSTPSAAGCYGNSGGTW